MRSEQRLRSETQSEDDKEDEDKAMNHDQDSGRHGQTGSKTCYFNSYSNPPTLIMEVKAEVKNLPQEFLQPKPPTSLLVLLVVFSTISVQ